MKVIVKLCLNACLNHYLILSSQAPINLMNSSKSTPQPSCLPSLTTAFLWYLYRFTSTYPSINISFYQSQYINISIYQYFNQYNDISVSQYIINAYIEYNFGILHEIPVHFYNISNSLRATPYCGICPPSTRQTRRGTRPTCRNAQKSMNIQVGLYVMLSS